MQQKILTLPVTLSANPGAYDYIHALRLYSADEIQFVAGDSQRMWFEAKGKFEFSQQGNSITLRIYEVTVFEPNDSGDSHETVQEFQCEATIESGQYFLPDEIPTAHSPNETRYFLLTRRLVFNEDPILLASNGGICPAESGSDISERIYYLMDDCRCGTMKDLTGPKLILPESF